MILTVLICTHNRADLLARALASLRTAKQPTDWTVRILVAANACTDTTHDLLEKQRNSLFNKPGLPNLEWFGEPHAGKSYALNSAIPRVESSDIVAFVDDDHRVDEDFLVEICKAAECYPDFTMFSGRILQDWDGSEPKWVHNQGPYKIRPLPIPRSDNGPISKELTLDNPTPGGGNLFIRGGVFTRNGKFRTDLGPQGHNLGGGEDTIFVQSALESGERLRYIPGVAQYHYVDPERLRFGYVLRKAYHRNRTVASAESTGNGVPAYMWRKLAGYLFAVVFTRHHMRRRFFLVRVAATLGEIAGRSQTNADRQGERSEGG